MATRPEQLYQDDFYAWTRDQAAALRDLADQRWNGPLDLLHLAEEVEDLGNAARSAVRSQLQRIIEHVLKLEYSPAAEPRTGWLNSIDDARGEIENAHHAGDPCRRPAPAAGPVCQAAPQGGA